MQSQVPNIRISSANEAPIKTDGHFVLYWLIANRRVRWNFSLERVTEWAKELGKPLLILEGLRSDYPWASDWLHSFIFFDNKSFFSCGLGARANCVPP